MPSPDPVGSTPDAGLPSPGTPPATLRDARFFETLIDILPVGVFHADVSGGCTYVNPSWCRIAGITVTAALGHGWIAALHPEDAERVARLWANSAQTGRDFAAEYRFVRADGRVSWVIGRARAVRDLREGVTAYVGTIEDISAQKSAFAAVERAQGEYLELLDALGFHAEVSVTMADGTIVYANERFCENSGYTQDEIIGANHRLVKSGHHSPEFYREMYETLQAGRVWRADFLNRSKSGKLYWMDTTIMPVPGPDGQIKRFISIRTDVTRLREAESALQASQRELRASHLFMRAVLDGTVLSVIATEIDGTIREFNSGAERMLGYARSELIGKATPALIHVPEEVANRAAVLTVELERPVAVGFETFVAKTLHTGKPDEHEWTYVRKDGTQIPVFLSVTTLRDAEGTVTGYLGVARDLSEIKQATEALAESRARIGTIFHAMSEGIVMQDAKAHILECNPAAWRMLGLTREQLLGLSSFDPRWSILHEDGSPYAPEQHPSVVASRTGQPVREQIMGVQLPEGGRRWISVNSEPLFDKQGRVQATVTGFVDVTQRKNTENTLRLAEERIRLAAESAEVGVWDFDLGTSCIAWDERMFAIYGLEPRPERLVPYETWSEAVLPEDLPEQEHLLQETLRHGGRGTRVFRIRRPDGQIRHVHAAEVVIRDSEGRPSRLVGVNRDITDQIELESRLAKARDEALQTSRLKSEFLANMSHEIRTPMNGIIGMADLIIDTALTPDQREMVRVIQNSAESLLCIINDILDFSKIEAGKLSLVQAEFDPRVLVQDVLALLANKAHEKGIELACDLDDQLDRTLVGDSGRIRQVLMNLAGNAIKFTEQGEVVVSASFNRLPGSQGRLSLRVRDTGIGIPDVVQRRLFQPFSQADGTDARRFGGTGLGLAISRQLVELMGGRIGLESTPGKGSEFWVELDLAMGNSLCADFSQRDPALRGRRVLVVDDNATNRRILERQLSASGLQPTVVGSGAEALRCLRGHRRAQPTFDLVLLDWQMPQMTGMELASAIHGDPETAALPLVMLSSAGPLVEADNAAAIGFEAYLSKPVRQLQLARCLTQILQRSQSSPPPRISAVEAAPRAPQAPAEPLAASAPDKPCAGLRILLVEDNPANQTVARLLLQRMGHTVRVAENGKACLAALAAEACDLILMDCQMPGMDGFETTRRIRAGAVPGRERTPVIALTAYAMLGDRTRCLESGMDEYVTKPVRADALNDAFLKCGFGRRLVAAAAEASRPEPAPAAPQKRPRILLAEDNPANQLVARKMLDKLGYDVDVALNGAQALEKLAQADYALVLMDCQMPVLDGWEATLAIRDGAVPGKEFIPVVALTAYNSAEERKRCLEAGMNAYLSKPLRAEEMSAALNEHIQQVAPPPAAGATDGLLDPGLVAQLREIPSEHPGKTLFDDLAEMFGRNEPERLRHLQQSLVAAEYEEAARQAHALAGNSGAVGALRLRTLALELERACRPGPPAPELLPVIEREMQRTLGALGLGG